MSIVQATITTVDGCIEFVMGPTSPLLNSDRAKYRANSQDDCRAYGGVNQTIRDLVARIIETVKPEWVEVWQYRLFVKLPKNAATAGASDSVQAMLEATQLTSV